ncbi:MAG: PQQ-binding-like beta-propeller repeat protein [bacterium]|nr:PQQ-binding-like beta-propeller repeat protein [bacterium]
MNRLRVSLLLFVLLAVSCSSRVKYTQEFAERSSAWPYHRGDLQSSGAAAEANFSGKLNLLWSDKYGYRPAAPLTVYHGHLVVTTTGKRVHFYDVANGSLYGKLRLSGTGQTAVQMQDSLLFIGLSPARNRVDAINLKTRKTIWRAPVKDAAPAPIILNDRLIISSSDGTVSALELTTGKHLWDFSGSGRFVAPIAYSDGRIFQPSDNGHLFALADSTGELLYEVKLDGPLVGGVAIADLLYVASMTGEVYGIQAETGTVLWQTRLKGPIWNAPAISGDMIILGHSGGEIVALSRNNGALIWSYPIVDVVKASPLLVGQFVVAGTMSGKLVVLNSHDGSHVAETEVTGAIAFPPVTDGTRIFVATQSGRILCYGDEHAQLTQDRQ